MAQQQAAPPSPDSHSSDGVAVVPRANIDAFSDVRLVILSRSVQSILMAKEHNNNDKINLINKTNDCKGE